MFSWSGSTAGGPNNAQLQSTGMLSREQLLLLFRENSVLLEKPETKERVKAGVKAGKEAAEITTEIQEELLQSMGVEPNFGIACLGRVSTIYQNDRELMTKFFEFVAKEEMACDEAELPADAFRQKKAQMDHMKQQQALMLQAMRQQPPEQQRQLMQQLQEQFQTAQAQRPAGSAMSPQEVLEFFQQQHRHLGQNTGR